jgi:hypothetical protein
MREMSSKSLTKIYQNFWGCDMEEWRAIVGYEGIYEVSNLGNVRSLDRVMTYPSGKTIRWRGKVLTPGKTGDRLTVALGNGTAKSYYVHDLVLTAFKGIRPVGKEGCHGDGNGVWNDITNLRWDTRSENMFDRVRHGTHHARNKEACPLEHLLVQPNLVAAKWIKYRHRICLACNRASAGRSQATQREASYDFKAEADFKYKKIMGLEK